MAGRKTHEQHRHILERKPDIPDRRREEDTLRKGDRDDQAHTARKDERDSEFTVSRGGLNQESGHNKHNDPGQTGHKPERHRPAEEKH